MLSPIRTEGAGLVILALGFAALSVVERPYRDEVDVHQFQLPELGDLPVLHLAPGNAEKDAPGALLMHGAQCNNSMMLPLGRREVSCCRSWSPWACGVPSACHSVAAAFFSSLLLSWTVAVGFIMY